MNRHLFCALSIATLCWLASGCRASAAIKRVDLDAVWIGGKGSLKETVLIVKTAAGEESRVALQDAVVDTYVVFEEAGYRGEPVPAIYRAGPRLKRRVYPAMKVREGFFMAGRQGGAASYRITGGSTLNRIDDVVKCGERPRPDVGGTFVEDTERALPLPSKGRPLRREWGPPGKESSWSTPEQRWPRRPGPTAATSAAAGVWWNALKCVDRSRILARLYFWPDEREAHSKQAWDALPESVLIPVTCYFRRRIEGK